MNAKITTPKAELPPPTDWRPPGWIYGDPDEPYTPEDRIIDGVEIPGIESRYKEFEAAGYYTTGGSLTEKAIGAKDEQEARDVAHNRRLLRDAWNTHPAAWRLARALIGRDFAVDPFWNQGAKALPSLAVKLDGQGPLNDGMLTVRQARAKLDSADFRALHGAKVCDVLEARLQALGDVPDAFPVNWRQHLKRGQAPAAVNGPHSCTADWLACVAAYGSQEFAAAFVPDNGDGWFQSIALTATLVVRLGRVPCLAPPGIKASSPRGASALCIWIPPKVRAKLDALQAQLLAASDDKERERITAKLDALLPAPTRAVLLHGEAFAVPLWSRPRAGTQLAIVQRGGLAGDESIVDLGIASAS